MTLASDRQSQAGRIEGLIFLEHGVCDIGLETVKWTREWIAGAGEQRLAR